MVGRFFNEAQAATRIEHPGIVEVFDFGHAPDGRAYLVMELLRGESLAQRLRRVGRIAPEPALRLLQQMASALAAAHHVGIVHRDLKPDNVFISPDPDIAGGERAKLLDFGIAKISETLMAGARQTRAGAIMGTPAYMAPEQCLGAGGVDHRADLYALGCIAFEMLCGRPPFAEQGLGELLQAHMSKEPPRLTSIDPSLPPGLEAHVARLLRKSPDAGPSRAQLAPMSCSNSLPSSNRLAPSASLKELAS
ncbi:serine/threonine-protein kinase [Haliangium sp.]|uniref:serine/threonine-protein kinase n=1 Tax=Haliangium sp. TaxID=2663208 RepID=UPI003D0EB0F8